MVFQSFGMFPEIQESTRSRDLCCFPQGRGRKDGSAGAGVQFP